MIERGEIYFVDLNPTKGREQSGRRPVLVLSVNATKQVAFSCDGHRRDERRKSRKRFSDKCSHLRQRKRFADGNRFFMFPDSLD